MLHIEVIARWTSYLGAYYFPSLVAHNNLIRGMPYQRFIVI